MYRPRGEGSLALAPDMRADLCSIPVSSLQNPLSNEKTDLIPVQALRLPRDQSIPSPAVRDHPRFRFRWTRNKLIPVAAALELIHFSYKYTILHAG